VLVAVDEEVYTLLKEQLLKAECAIAPRPEALLGGLLIAVAIAAAVHGAVAVDDDPGHSLTVGVGFNEVLLQKLVLVCDQLVPPPRQHGTTLDFGGD